MTDTSRAIQQDTEQDVDDLPSRFTDREVMTFLVVVVLGIAFVVLLVQLHGLRDDVANLHVDNSPTVDLFPLEQDVSDLCRMVGALAAEQGIPPAQLLADPAAHNASEQVWSSCAYSAIDAGRRPGE